MMRRQALSAILATAIVPLLLPCSAASARGKRPLCRYEFAQVTLRLAGAVEFSVLGKRTQPQPSESRPKAPRPAPAGSAPGIDPFSDVPPSHWAYNALEFLRQEGVATGFSAWNGMPVLSQPADVAPGVRVTQQHVRLVQSLVEEFRPELERMGVDIPDLQTRIRALRLHVASGKPDAPFDVAVYAGVPCGFAAAVAAARDGARVLLIEPTKHVGGLNTSGLNTAETEHMLKWTFGGVALEFYTRVGKEYGQTGPAYYFDSTTAEGVFDEMLREAGVEVRYGARVERVEKEGARIRAIALSDGTRVEAKVFVDAGYEGDLMARAGVGYTWGRESRDEFGESKAGISFDPPRRAATVDEKGNLLPGISGWARDFHEGDGDRRVMNYNWRLTFAKDPALRAPIPLPKHYDRARYRLLENWLREKSALGEAVQLKDIIDLYTRRGGRYEVNNKQAAVISIGDFGAQFDYPDGDYATRERVIAEHTEYTLGLFHFLATDEAVPETLRTETRKWGLHKDEFADNGNWPYQFYVREGRRMRGAYVVTQRDVTEERRKPDAIAVGSHFVDSHHVQRLALSPTEFVNEGRIWLPGWAYQIPYRAITPKPEECSNLLVPGAASYTHVAYCTYRLESTWMMAGHAAGTAAALAAREGKAVQQLDVPALQEKLRAEKQVIDFLPGQPEQFGGKG